MGYTNDPFSDFVFFKNGFHPQVAFRALTDMQTKIPYPLDAYLTDEFLVFEIPIVNGKSEDIEITKSSDELRLKYTRSNRSDEQNRKCLKRGMSQRDFDLVWKITNKFDARNIQSVYENGLLSVFIPFAEEQKPEKVQVLDTLSNWKKLGNGEL